MVASVRNGFRHILWDPVNFTCNGRPYAFHAMYDRALPPLPNGQPTAWTTWSAHTDNVAYDVETGHFEPPDAATDQPTVDDPPCFTGPLIPGAWAQTPTSTATHITPEIGPTGGATPRRRTTSVRRGRRRPPAPIRSLGSRPTCPGSRRPTTAARCPATTTPARAAPTRRPARSIPGTTCSRRPSSTGRCAWALTERRSPQPAHQLRRRAGRLGPARADRLRLRQALPQLREDDHSQPLPVGAPGAPDRRRDRCRRGGDDRDRAGQARVPDREGGLEHGRSTVPSWSMEADARCIT